MGTIVNKTIQEATARLKENYEAQKIFDMSLGDCVPNRDAIISIIEGLRTVTFPGFFGSENMAYVSKDNFAGSTLAILYERLFKQVRVALKFDNKELADAEIRAKAEEYTSTFIAKIPDIQAMILKDVDAEFNGDPAAKDHQDIILSYPGIFTIFVYRYAHVLYELNVPYIPRIMTEYAHGLTGIDINPGATIGEYFCIDHGTGIVIGETTTIGDHVKIYQGVTLGGVGLNKGKRHPTLGNNVTVGCGAKILGAFEVGDNCNIAANAVLLKPLDNDTTAVGIPARPVKVAGVPIENRKKAVTMEHFEKMEQRVKELEAELERLKGELEEASREA